MSGPTVAVVDYGSGNLRSAERAVAATGADVVVTTDVGLASRADGVVLPGVGAFAACMTGIRAAGADVMIRERVAGGGAVLGICVGMQVLFASGDEHGEVTDGIGLLDGKVEKLSAPVLPHMGWNTVEAFDGSAMFAGVGSDRFYFVHSFGVLREPGDGLTTTVHGASRFVAGIESGSLWATQFHPEKSAAAGARVLRNWVATL